MRKFKGNGFNFGWADYVEYDGINLWFVFEHMRPNRPIRELSNRWSIKECEQFVKDKLWVEIKETNLDNSIIENRGAATVQVVVSSSATSALRGTNLARVDPPNRFSLLELE